MKKMERKCFQPKEKEEGGGTSTFTWATLVRRAKKEVLFYERGSTAGG